MYEQKLHELNTLVKRFNAIPEGADQQTMVDLATEANEKMKDLVKFDTKYSDQALKTLKIAGLSLGTIGLGGTTIVAAATTAGLGAVAGALSLPGLINKAGVYISESEPLRKSAMNILAVGFVALIVACPPAAFVAAAALLSLWAISSLSAVTEPLATIAKDLTAESAEITKQVAGLTATVAKETGKVALEKLPTYDLEDKSTDPTDDEAQPSSGPK